MWFQWSLAHTYNIIISPLPTFPIFFNAWEPGDEATYLYGCNNYAKSHSVDHYNFDSSVKIVLPLPATSVLRSPATVFGRGRCFPDSGWAT